jgi:hypothetical protein
MGATVSIDRKDINMCGWIEGIVMANFPFAFVENDWARKNVILQHTSVNTLKNTCMC